MPPGQIHAGLSGGPIVPVFDYELMAAHFAGGGFCDADSCARNVANPGHAVHDIKHALADDSASKSSQEKS